jgi:hypothetical protein
MSDRDNGNKSEWFKTLCVSAARRGLVTVVGRMLGVPDAGQLLPRPKQTRITTAPTNRKR